MNKVLIELHVPAMYAQFDIFAPNDVPIKDLIGILTNGVVEITNEKYIASGSEQLCLKEPTGLLNPSLTLQDYGINDSTQLFLI